MIDSVLQTNFWIYKAKDLNVEKIKERIVSDYIIN